MYVGRRPFAPPLAAPTTPLPLPHLYANSRPVADTRISAAVTTTICGICHPTLTRTPSGAVSMARCTSAVSTKETAATCMPTTMRRSAVGCAHDSFVARNAGMIRRSMSGTKMRHRIGFTTPNASGVRHAVGHTHRSIFLRCRVHTESCGGGEGRGE